MRNTIFALIWLIPLLGCLSLNAGDIYVINSASRTLSHIDSDTGQVNNSFAQLGLTANLMDLDEDRIYITCSGDNAIQVLSRDNGAHISYIPVAASSNPWDVVKSGDFLYVSGLFTNKVYKLSLLTNSVAGSLEVGDSPEGLAIGGDRLFVCNTGGYANNYANSSISVIDLETFSLEATIPVWTNPQYATVHGNRLHVSCTGNWSNVAGKIDVIDLVSLEPAARLNIGGNPGCIWVSEDGTALVGDGMGNALYSYDANSLDIFHDSNNPLSLNAFAISGTEGRIAMLEQNWTGNSQVRVYGSDLSLLAEYSVGISSTDLLFFSSAGSIADDEIAQLELRVFPNPLGPNGILHLTGQKVLKGTFSLYNLKGQSVLRRELQGRKNDLTLGSLTPGVYLFRIQSGRDEFRGKLLISR